MKSFPFNYHLSEDELQVRIGGKVIRRIRYSDISEIEEGCAFWNEHWTNFWPWRHVTIRRKTGFIKNFVITAEDPASFISELKGKLTG